MVSTNHKLMSMALVSALSMPSAIAQEVSLELTGEIELSCAFEKVGSDNEVINLDEPGPGQIVLDLEVDCNAPFVYTVESENGGFLNDAAQGIESALGTALIPYQATINIDGLADAGQSPALASSAEMSRQNGGFSVSSNGIVAFQSGGEILLEWDTSGDNLFAGDYSDTITLTIAADAATALVN